MDNFKKASLNDYEWELEYSHELCKNKLRKEEKKIIRRLSRKRLKRVKEKEDD